MPIASFNTSAHGDRSVVGDRAGTATARRFTPNQTGGRRGSRSVCRGGWTPVVAGRQAGDDGRCPSHRVGEACNHTPRRRPSGRLGATRPIPPTQLTLTRIGQRSRRESPKLPRTPFPRFALRRNPRQALVPSHVRHQNDARCGRLSDEERAIPPTNNHDRWGSLNGNRLRRCAGGGSE